MVVVTGVQRVCLEKMWQLVPDTTVLVMDCAEKSMALVDTKVVKEAVEGLETLVEMVMAPAMEVEAKRSDVVTTETVVGPEGDVEASVSPRSCAVQGNMVGTDAEKEPVVLVLAVFETVRVSETVVLFVVNTENVEKSVVSQEAVEGAVMGLMVSEPVLEAVVGTDAAVDSMADLMAVGKATQLTDTDVTSEAGL